MDDGVREIAGVKGKDADGKGRNATVSESVQQDAIILHSASDVYLTPDAARRLALHLNVLAARVSERSQ
jgi:hypothetical protein